MEGSVCYAVATWSRSRLPGTENAQHNTVFRNLGRAGKWAALTEEAGWMLRRRRGNRGCALGDFDGDGRVHGVAAALSAPAEIWMNRSGTLATAGFRSAGSPEQSRRDWRCASKVVSATVGAQYNHMTPACAMPRRATGGAFWAGARPQRRRRWKSTGPRALCRP